MSKEEARKVKRKSVKEIDFSVEPYLEIILIKGNQLRSADITGFSDPYVVFSNGGTSVQSKIKYQTLNPKWNETLLLPVKKDDRVLELTVNDWDPFKSPDFLGKAFLSLDDLIKNNETFFNIKLSTKGSIDLKLTAKNFGQTSSAKEIAIFGSEGNGKSTFVKQFQYYNKSLSQKFTFSFFSSLLEITKTCISICQEKDKKEPFENNENEFYSQWILELFKDDEVHLDSTITSVFKSPGISNSFISLWKDKKMMDTLKSLENSLKLLYYHNLPEFLEKNLNNIKLEEENKYVIDDFIIILKNVFEKSKLSLKDDLKKLYQNLLVDETVNQNWNDYKVLLFEKSILDYVAKTDFSNQISPFSKFTFLNYHKLKHFDPKEYVKYEPSIEHLITISQRSKGIQFDKTVKYLEKEICLIETSGSESERTKWKILSSDHSIYCSIYMIDLSSFDQLNELGKNRLLEDLEAFNYYLSLFKDNQLLLFFNKNDEFQKKIKERDLGEIFPEYKGGKSYPFALKFITDKYRNLFKGSNKLISIHIGSALNSKEITKVLTLILKGNPLLSQHHNIEEKSPATKKSQLPFDSSIEEEPTFDRKKLEEKKIEKLEEVVMKLEHLNIIDTYYERIERQKKMTKEEIEKEEGEFISEFMKTPKSKCQMCNDNVGFIKLNGCSELLCNECFSMVQSSSVCPICEKVFHEVTNIFTNQIMKIE